MGIPQHGQIYQKAHKEGWTTMQYIKKPRQVEGGQSRNFMTVIEVREIEYAL